jgi:hypothetical protein
VRVFPSSLDRFQCWSQSAVRGIFFLSFFFFFLGGFKVIYFWFFIFIFWISCFLFQNGQIGSSLVYFSWLMLF